MAKQREWQLPAAILVALGWFAWRKRQRRMSTEDALDAVEFGLLDGDLGDPIDLGRSAEKSASRIRKRIRRLNRRYDRAKSARKRARLKRRIVKLRSILRELTGSPKRQRKVMVRARQSYRRLTPGGGDQHCDCATLCERLDETDSEAFRERIRRKLEHCEHCKCTPEDTDEADDLDVEDIDEYAEDDA